MHRAIVSGITGLVGRELTRQLVAADVDVHGLTRQDITGVQPTAGAVHFHRIDGSTETITNLLKRIRPDTVFHLAAIARREHLTSDVIPFVETNILFGTQLLEGMRLAQCTRFITAGSYLQHSDTEQYRALNLYAATKQAFEDLLVYYADTFGFSAVRLTLCNIYSETDRGPTLMTDIAVAWAGSTPLSLHTDGARIDLVHVEDVAAAFIRAASLLEEGAVDQGTLRRYSVSSGRDMTPAEVVALFEHLGDRKLVIKREESGSSPRRTRPWRGPIVPGWTPQVTLETGIRRILSRRS
jgi:nucleoside-diphosphate-sugar epimerase